MASLGTSEKRAFNSNDFLTSLMEELQDHVEEGDEERLNCVIQSLEAEINSSITDVYEHDACTEPDHQSICNGDQDSQYSSGLGHMDDRDCMVSFDDLDLNGWNIGQIEAVPCSPRYDMNWDIYRFGEEISNSFIGFEGISSTDSSVHTYDGVAMDDHSLWQEYDSVMYH